MILPPELQRYQYVLDDAPHALEAIVRYCDLHHDALIGVNALFGLDEVPDKTGKSGLQSG